jgi:hypothetical protein
MNDHLYDDVQFALRWLESREKSTGKPHYTLLYWGSRLGSLLRPTHSAKSESLSP